MGFETIIPTAAAAGTVSTLAAFIYTTIRSWMLKFSAIERTARDSLQAAEELDLLGGELDLPGDELLDAVEMPSRNAQPMRRPTRRPDDRSKSIPRPPIPPRPAPYGPSADGSAQRQRPTRPSPGRFEPASGRDLDQFIARGADVPGSKNRAPSVEALQAREYFAHITNAKRQSAIYFWTYLLSGVLGVSLLLAAAGLAVFGSRDIAIFTTICGALPTAISGLFYKRAGDVDKAARDNLALLDKAVENAKRMKSAREAASKLPPGPERGRILSMIAVRQLFPDATPADLAALLSQSNHSVDIAHPRDSEPERS
ncbi:hypothetical protein [Nocardia sp. NPDC051981]|uniref:TRADD-N-associated membrane domain-containing protein n=1 Tax=Nocardia sp. NPDC051981 TaxID=3155417 RepID=UPI0034362585